jgi:hypothetical protein
MPWIILRMSDETKMSKEDKNEDELDEFKEDDDDV